MRTAQLRGMMYFACLLGMLHVGWTYKHSSGKPEEILDELNARIEAIEEYIIKTGNIADMPPYLVKRVQEHELGDLELEELALGDQNTRREMPTATLNNQVTDNKDAYTYLGCYKDSRTRTLPYRCRVHRLTNDRCKQCCVMHKFTYFGTEIGNECYCGNEIKARHEVVNDSDCSSKCRGDKGPRCGGAWRVSIYQISDVNVPKFET